MPVDPKDKQTVLNDLRSQLARLGYDNRRASSAPPKPSAHKAPASPAPPPSAPGTTREPLVYHRDLPRAAANRPAARPLSERYRVDLAAAVPDGIECMTARGPLFEVSKHVGEIPDAAHLSETFRRHLFDDRSPLCTRIRNDCTLDDLACHDLVFMDIETTGLSSSPLFLIGIMVWEETGFVVRQFFARNYAEEAATILRFVEECAPRRLLVTFNGKSFDFPYIRTRAVATGVSFDLAPAHLDLLHVGRRIWKGALPNCKLQTIEKHVCGRSRHGDIPGSDIPDAYHTYVRTNDAWQMVDALTHNTLDLVTLADMMTRFPSDE